MSLIKAALVGIFKAGSSRIIVNNNMVIDDNADVNDHNSDVNIDFGYLAWWIPG